VELEIADLTCSSGHESVHAHFVNDFVADEARKWLFKL